MKHKDRQAIESKYKQPVADVLLELLNNNTVADTCAELGITSPTLYNWAHSVGLQRRWVKT